MRKREYVQLAHTYDPKKHGIGGWWISEKLDGMRCMWDGGVSRGLTKASVPYANHDKDGRYVSQPQATGLWSRYGNVIHAPDWWLNQLPSIPLDGELYIKGARQDLMRIVKKLEPDNIAWRDVQYHVFDAVPVDAWLEEGRINNPNFELRITAMHLAWYNLHATNMMWVPKISTPFRSRIKGLGNRADENDVFVIHEQKELPMQTERAVEEANKFLNSVLEQGGEGAIVRNPNTRYTVHRSNNLLKMKPFSDMEGTVIGFVSGRATDRGSKLLGLIGALILRLDNGKVMELSGFTDEERTLQDPEWAEMNPGIECPDWIEGVYFKRGDRVTFKYRGITNDGIPQEARYWRKR